MAGRQKLGGVTGARTEMMFVFLVALVTVASGLESNCHPSTGECYDEPPAIDQPHIWLGNEAPNICGRMKEDCALYGFDYDVSHPRGPVGADWCEEGTKIRCVSPTPPPLTTTPANHFKVVTYNIWERDFYMSIDGQRERTCRIPRWFAQNLPDVDAFLFQETFMGGCWHTQATLRDLLAQHGYPYSTATTENKYKVQPGGIFVASRWPIVEHDMYVFKDFLWKTWDAFAAKGVSYAKVEKTVDGVTHRYNLMSTHLQAGGGKSDKPASEARIAEAAEWRVFLDSKKIPKDEAVFFGGDLNTNLFTETVNLDTIMHHLSADLPHPITDKYKYTSDAELNDVQRTANPTGKRSWIDIMLYSNRHWIPVKSSQEVVVPAAEEEFPICWCEECIPLRTYRYPDDPACPRVVKVKHLSDHQPVLATYVF